MKITEIHFRRKFNLGNYETMDIEFVATISQDQKPMEILKMLDDKTIQYRNKRSGV